MGDEDNDYVYADLVNDHIHGNRGNDLVFGGDGNDIVRRGLGDDVVYGDREMGVHGDPNYSLPNRGLDEVTGHVVSSGASDSQRSGFEESSTLILYHWRIRSSHHRLKNWRERFTSMTGFFPI